MDFTIQMRGIDLLIKFLKHDLAEVPNYGYQLQKLPTPKAQNPCLLPRSSPEEMGLPSSALLRFFQGLDAEPEMLGIHSAMVLRHGHVVAQAHWAPYEGDLPHMLYSMSKSITATAVGFALDEGILALDDRVVDILDGELQNASRPMRQLTIRHLLTMSSGSRFNEVGSMLDGDWVRMFLESTPKFEPGTAFEYNSLNTYMLAAILCKKTGMSLVEYLKPRLFAPLHIEEFTWERCPQGIEKGGWGLSLRIEDAAKLGQLYLQKGVWEGKQLLSEAWVEAASSKQIDTPKGESPDGYGFQVWMLPGGGFQFRGVFGQYVFMLPQYDAVVALFSGSSTIFAQTPLMQLVDDCFREAASAPLPPDPAANAQLAAYSSLLQISPPLPYAHYGTEPAAFAAMASALQGQEYRFDSNTCGLLPQIIQCVHGNYTMGTDHIRFWKEGDRLYITFYEGYERNTLCVAGDGGFVEGAVALRGERHIVRTRGLWQVEGDGEILLVLLASFIETPDTRVILLHFSQDTLRICYEERPTMQGAAEQLFMLVGASQLAFFRRLLPVAKRTPGLSEDSLLQLMQRFSAPSAEGRRIICNEEEPCRIATRQLPAV